MDQPWVSIRGIVEHNGETLFATEDGIERYNENTNTWNTTWEAGNGLLSNAGDIFYELWTDGTHLVVGGADFTGFGQFEKGSSHIVTVLVHGRLTPPIRTTTFQTATLFPWKCAAAC